MSEGELKKRIIEKRVAFECNELDLIGFKELFQILDEAKKSWVDLDEYFEEERSEVARKWIKYWFGE